MTLQTASQQDMWVCGWMLGKYDQLEDLPHSVPEAKEWWSGFTMGNVEACLYEKTQDRLELLLADHPKEYRLLKTVVTKNN